MLSDEKRQQLQDLAQAASEQTAYEEHPIYGHIPADADLEGRKWQNVSEIYDSLNLANFNRMNVKSLQVSSDMDLDDMQAAITEETGLTEFSLLKQGNSSVVLLGKSEDDLSVLRIVASPNSKAIKMFPSMRGDTMRPQFSGIIQGKSEPLEIGGAMHVEVLPFVQMADLSSEQLSLYRDYLNDLCEGTSYSPDVNEVIVTPDGTLMSLDPGECGYTAEFWDMGTSERWAAEEESKAAVALREASWNAPDQLKWTNSDGGLKQNQFFPPYKADTKIITPDDANPDHTPANN